MSNLGKKIMFFFGIIYIMFFVYLIFIFIFSEIGILFLKPMVINLIKNRGFVCIFIDFWLKLSMQLVIVLCLYTLFVVLLKNDPEHFKNIFRKGNGPYNEKIIEMIAKKTVKKGIFSNFDRCLMVFLLLGASMSFINGINYYFCLSQHSVSEYEDLITIRRGFFDKEKKYKYSDLELAKAYTCHTTARRGKASRIERVVYGKYKIVFKDGVVLRFEDEDGLAEANLFEDVFEGNIEEVEFEDFRKIKLENL